MDSSIFLFIIPYFFACTLAATSPTILLNSSEPTSWLNDNSIDMNVNSTDGSKVRAILSRTRSLGFVSGFYCTGNCTSYYFGITVVGGGNPALVWSANPEHPVSENANLTLTREGDLVLRNPDGSTVWSTGTAGISVAGMNLTELGNLVLFNETGAVWQSFDHPTDTLLAGQRLYEDQRLVSGLYYATVTISGLAAFTRVGNGGSQMYYQLEPEPDTTDQSSLRGRCPLLTKIEVNTSDNAELQTRGFLENMGSNRSKLPLDLSVEYVRLNSNGSLKLYRHEPATRANEIVDMVTKDFGVCQLPRQCGDFGFCDEGICGCPKGVKGFKWKNDRCSRTTQLCQARSDKADLVEMKNVSYFNFIDPNAAASNITDLESCKEACHNNCSCEAAFYGYDNNNHSNGFCYIPSEVLSVREGEIPNYNFTSTAYIKVEKLAPKNRNRLIEIIAGSGSAVLLIFCLSILIFWKKFSKTITEDVEEYMRQVPGMPVMFTHEQLRVATRDFKERLGSGGFGSVFKGVLPDGTEIAVKRLHKVGHAVREFIAEVETIGSIHHFNLVRLVGFSADKSCLLVYEYMSNGSLDQWIFHRDQKPCLDWETRKKITHQIAKGLAYLHEECRQRIIHLDIKPQNILLDANFNAKISDFGLSKLVDRDNSQVLITLRGTPGYIAPECGHSNSTTKVDIYSFGIVLLEIVTGRKNLDGTRSESSKHLLSLMQKKARDDQLLDIVEDLNEEMPENREEMLRMIRIAAWCLQNDPTKRPLMSTVVKVLEGVMEVDPSISYDFTHAMGSSSVASGHVSATLQSSVLSTPMQASVLSNPR
ncbi:G-type lectin S-receptor-like serine/threonine-protein kinase SD2-5 [Rhododendron vialii]|uniref:G-type lectin S-receptor-like serine/threonine-protein kinase SD2-5 n=1 Tax=Rhododendron vialii TaxID=182163 RepID=UPI00265EDA08|nr:G-type lectin S-receptor-like serine/threonine-protein kinase SD2-5 [Rhododendron vialii]XP_058208680.1 G-type lectin S-receptor-like serine/threonine-protein kinase SD2-5 [Rhododendron vialii]XP_058208681.1 G-type lectin S-receptor-like serine/threonine-protein kinase SD2-5 [Rhododendron vialii]XP_058208682.1 G-type lectin S-receptor-like serine/threonine-protein kinase SD2-5 [Rhododendron vialii]XP_058208683.1 G-type lectin S-receptor-like serine/threonine-protein kinase SD2-5 [Rhododendro